MKRILFFLILLPFIGMSQVKISELPLYSGAADNGSVPVVIGLTTYKVLGKQLASGKLDSVTIKPSVDATGDSLFAWKGGIRALIGKTTPGGGGGGGSVLSVHGRTGVVAALEADYSAFYPVLSGSYANPSWITSLPFSKITATPTTRVGYGITDAEGTITAGTTLQYWRGDKTFQTLNTSVVPELTNLYFTDARARAAFSAGNAIDPVQLATGVVAVDPDGLPADSTSFYKSADSVFQVRHYYNNTRDTIFAFLDASGGGSGGADVITIHQEGLTGDSLLRASNDTLYSRRLRDSTGIELSYAPDGALVIRNTGSVGGATLNSTQVGYGDGANLLTGEASFIYNASANRAEVDSVKTNRIRLNRVSEMATGNHILSPDALIAGKALSATATGYAVLIESSGTGILFGVRQDGRIIYGNSSGTSYIELANWVPGQNNVNIRPTGGASGLYGIDFLPSSNWSATSGVQSTILVQGNATLTNSSAYNNQIRLQSTLEQSGTSNGIMRGIYDTSILKTLVDYRAIETMSDRVYFGSNRLDAIDTLQTTNATQTTIGNIAIPTDATVEIDITVVAKDASNNAAFYRRMARFKNVSGTVTQIGTTQTIGTDDEEAAMTACDVALDISGTNVRVRGTGIAATNINWRPIYSMRKY